MAFDSNKRNEVKGKLDKSPAKMKNKKRMFEADHEFSRLPLAEDAVRKRAKMY